MTALTIIWTWLWGCPSGQNQTSGSRRIIPIAYDRNRIMFNQGRCTDTVDNKAQPELERSETDENVWYSLPCSGVMETVRPGLRDALQGSHWYVNEEPLTARDFVTAQMIEYHCMEVTTTSTKPWSVYWYDWEGVLIRQCKKDSSVQEVVPASWRPLVLYMAHYRVLAVLSRERHLTIRGNASFIRHIEANDTNTTGACWTDKREGNGVTSFRGE